MLGANSLFLLEQTSLQKMYGVQENKQVSLQLFPLLL